MLVVSSLYVPLPVQLFTFFAQINVSDLDWIKRALLQTRDQYLSRNNRTISIIVIARLDIIVADVSLKIIAHHDRLIAYAAQSRKQSIHIII
jgi:hypothetical protein